MDTLKSTDVCRYFREAGLLSEDCADAASVFFREAPRLTSSISFSAFSASLRGAPPGPVFPRSPLGGAERMEESPYAVLLPGYTRYIPYTVKPSPLFFNQSRRVNLAGRNTA